MSMALYAADMVIVPVDVGSIHSLDGLDAVLDLIDAIRPMTVRIVMNKADKRTLISRLMIEDIQKNFEGAYFKTIIPICTAIQQAEYRRQSLFQYKPSASSLFCELATELRRLA